MDKKMKFMYDESGEVMDIDIGKPRPTISEEIVDNFFIRLSPKNGKIVGFMIMNFKKSFFLKNIMTGIKH